MGITRRGFIRDALGAAAVARAGFSREALAATNNPSPDEGGFYRKLVRSNDAAAPRVLEQLKNSGRRVNARAVGEAVDRLAGAYCAPESSYFQSAALLPALHEAADKLL